MKEFTRTEVIDLIARLRRSSEEDIASLNRKYGGLNTIPSFVRLKREAATALEKLIEEVDLVTKDRDGLCAEMKRFSEKIGNFSG